jgi:hypothetical protein
MTAVSGKLITQTTANRRLAIGVAVLLVASGLLAALGRLMPIAPLLRGWLVAFAIFGSIPIGSVIWLLIHRLTGGEWGIAAAPVLRPAAAMSPMLIVAFVPVLAGLHQVYPWAANPTTIPADVAHWYLNGTSFVLRSLIALIGWSYLALLFSAGPGSRLLAGLGLAFFGLTISLVAVDWYLSLEPHYVATAFAAMIAVQQLLMAVAVTALIGPTMIEGKVAGDLGALLLATLLGVVYLGFMTFVVAWYGDLPEKASWFSERSSSGWMSVLMMALVVGVVAPLGMLLREHVRRNRHGLRIASVLILIGTALHFVWLLVPAFDDQAAVTAGACAGIAVLALVSYLTGPALAQLLEARHAQ